MQTEQMTDRKTKHYVANTAFRPSKKKKFLYRNVTKDENFFCFEDLKRTELWLPLEL